MQTAATGGISHEHTCQLHPPRPALAEKYGIQRPAGDRERDTSIADYVWLPFRFEGDMPYLDWHDEWCIEDYE